MLVAMKQDSLAAAWTAPTRGSHLLPNQRTPDVRDQRAVPLLRRGSVGVVSGTACLDCVVVSAEEVDEYLRGVGEPKRSTLQTLRRTILEIVPDAEEVISYRVPAFRLRGATIAGFAAFKDHLSYLPFSGSILPQLGDELEGYTMTKGALHFPVDRPLPKSLVKKLIALRLADASRRSR